MTITRVEETQSKLLSVAHIQLLNCKIQQEPISHHDSKVSINNAYRGINIEVQYSYKYIYSMYSIYIYIYSMYRLKEHHRTISDLKTRKEKLAVYILQMETLFVTPDI